MNLSSVLSCNSTITNQATSFQVLWHSQNIIAQAPGAAAGSGLKIFSKYSLSAFLVKSAEYHSISNYKKPKAIKSKKNYFH